MPKMSPAALVTRTALFTAIAPRLAKDAKINYNAIVNGITSKNYNARRNQIFAAATLACDGKLAKDADIQDLANLLDALSPDVENADQMSLDPNAGSPMAGAPIEGAPDGEPEDTLAKIKQYLEQQGVSPEIIDNLDAFMAEPSAPPPDQPATPPNGNGDVADCNDEDLPPPTGMDEEDDEEDKGEDEVIPSEQKGLDEMVPSEQKGLDKAFVSKDEMQKAIRTAHDAAINTQRRIRAAERTVRPWVGDVAMDSARNEYDVYRTALKALGRKDVDKLHHDALLPILENTPKPSANRPSPRVAADSAPEQSFAERFPFMDSIRIQ
jgi:hypothetical protein